jgi:hypothetical protein
MDQTVTPAIDPITVEVIGSAFASIAEEMGEALVRASYSTNIKERRDCSTALFDTRGNTLCQAEHIPMHLGSFIGILPHVLKRHRVEDMAPGDVFVGNDAYEGGGTHLPDIVLAEPIFVAEKIIGWAVNTAHHADFADRGHAHIYQEGLRIPPIRLYRAGVLQTDVQELILLNCQVPRERLSDLRAQMAANRMGVERMQALCAKYGTSAVLAAGVALQDYAERGNPGRHVSFRRPVRQSRDGHRPRIFLRDHRGGRRDAAAFRQPAPGARRVQHGVHRAALDRLLRGENRGGSHDPAECRPRAPARGDGAGRHGVELRASRRGQRARRHLPARRRSHSRGTRPGGAGAGDRGLQRLLRLGHVHRRAAGRWQPLGLS